MQNRIIIPAPHRPMSVFDIREANPKLFYSKGECWYTKKEEEFFHGDETGDGWICLLENIPTDSKVSYNAAEIVWFLVELFKLKGIHFLESSYVRTASRDSLGSLVNVGPFKEEGIYLGTYIPFFSLVSQ